MKNILQGLLGNNLILPKKKLKRKAKSSKLMKEFRDKELGSGSKGGRIIKNPKRTIAIAIAIAKKKRK